MRAPLHACLGGAQSLLDEPHSWRDNDGRRAPAILTDTALAAAHVLLRAMELVEGVTSLLLRDNTRTN